jgi:hypothetical protein
MLNPSWYANPRMQHENFEKEKKKTYFTALQTQWDTLGHTMTFGMSPKTVEKQLQ